MTQKNDSIIHNCVYSGNSIIRDRKRDESERFICPDGQKSNKNLFDNLRLFEPEIFLSLQTPKIILMILYDFCSEGA